MYSKRSTTNYKEHIQSSRDYRAKHSRAQQISRNGVVKESDSSQSVWDSLPKNCVVAFGMSHPCSTLGT